jgi:hypothetical protein
MAHGSTDTRSQPSGGYPVLSCRPPKGSARTGFPHRVGIEYASWRAQSGGAPTGAGAGPAVAHLRPGQRDSPAGPAIPAQWPAAALAPTIATRTS